MQILDQNGNEIVAGARVVHASRMSSSVYLRTGTVVKMKVETGFYGGSTGLLQISWDAESVYDDEVKSPFTVAAHNCLVIS